jgi:hypothetical protein
MQLSGYILVNMQWWHLGNIGRSDELDVERIIKTKKNTVGLRTAKNKHDWFGGLNVKKVSLKLYITIVALQTVKRENMNNYQRNRMLKYNIMNSNPSKYFPIHHLPRNLTFDDNLHTEGIVK